MKRFFGWILVLLQFSCIGFFIVRFSWRDVSLISGLLIVAGVLLGIWSLWVMRRSKLRILPDPSENAVLITEGPYKIIRHPMYSAVLLFCAGLNHWVVFEEYMVYIMLFITLVVKLFFEEQMLAEKFENYCHYQLRSYRIVPFIF